jgi:hypothetical protein
MVRSSSAPIRRCTLSATATDSVAAREQVHCRLNLSVVTTDGHSPFPQISVSPTTSLPSVSSDHRRMFDSQRCPSGGVVSVLISSVPRLSVARESLTILCPSTMYSLRLSAANVNRASRCGGLTRVITSVVSVCVTRASVPNQNWRTLAAAG